MLQSRTHVKLDVGDLKEKEEGLASKDKDKSMDSGSMFKDEYKDQIEKQAAAPSPPADHCKTYHDVVSCTITAYNDHSMICHWDGAAHVCEAYGAAPTSAPTAAPTWALTAAPTWAPTSAPTPAACPASCTAIIAEGGVEMHYNFCVLYYDTCKDCKECASTAAPTWAPTAAPSPPPADHCKTYNDVVSCTITSYNDHSMICHWDDAAHVCEAYGTAPTSAPTARRTRR